MRLNIKLKDLLNNKIQYKMVATWQLKSSTSNNRSFSNKPSNLKSALKVLISLIKRMSLSLSPLKAPKLALRIPRRLKFPQLSLLLIKGSQVTHNIRITLKDMVTVTHNITSSGMASPRPDTTHLQLLDKQALTEGSTPTTISISITITSTTIISRAINLLQQGPQTLTQAKRNN